VRKQDINIIMGDFNSKLGNENSENLVGHEKRERGSPSTILPGRRYESHQHLVPITIIMVIHMEITKEQTRYAI